MEQSLERIEKLLNFIPQIMDFLVLTSKKSFLVIEKKGEIDLVTEADRGSESRLIDFISQHFPNDSILGEEGANIQGSSEFKWIIDPLDGTTNYSHNIPLYAISIGIENMKSGIIEGGLVALPALGDIYHSVKNQGAFKNNRRINVSQNNDLIESLTCTGFPYNRKEEMNFLLNTLGKFLNSTRGIRRTGAAALDLVWLAEGRFDIFYEINLNPWDVAAGICIIEEAGGKVSKLDGSKLELYKPEILATNSILHDKVLEIFRVHN